MKKSLIRRTCFRGGTALLALLMPFTLFTSNAAQLPGDGESLSAFRVKFLGGDNEALLFNVKYNNKDRSHFRLVVLDETGEALFEDNYSKNLDRELIVPRLTDSEHVIFIVKPEKDSPELSFKVKITTRVVDDALATRN
jgi:hypothetical protein